MTLSSIRTTRAVVMARGLGTRMRAGADAAALDPAQAAAADAGLKAMMPFGRPFLDFVLHDLAEAGIREVALVLGPEHDVVREYYRTVPKSRIAIAYDSKRGRVVLFGGASAPPGPNQPQTFLADTWLWDGERWQKAADSGPPGRYAHGMVFDERAGVVLLYSGAAAHRNAPLSDMWQWDGERYEAV